MRTVMLTLALLSLAANPAFATIGGKGGGNGGGGNTKYASLRVTNTSDFGVAGTVNDGLASFQAEPKSSQLIMIPVKSNKATVTVKAHLLDAPSISSSADCKVQGGLTTPVTIVSDGSNLTITSSAPGGFVLTRELGVVLASSSGLMSLLWLSLLLGRPSRRREPLVEMRNGPDEARVCGQA